MIHENFMKLEFQYPLSNILLEKGQAHLLQLWLLFLQQEPS